MPFVPLFISTHVHVHIHMHMHINITCVSPRGLLGPLLGAARHGGAGGVVPLGLVPSVEQRVQWHGFRSVTRAQEKERFLL